MALRDLFEIAENPNNYSAVRIKIATSDELPHGHMVKSALRKPLTTGHLSRNEMVCFAERFSARYMTMNVSAVNTNA